MYKVVNLFSGPGAGKSTTAAGVFALLKLHGVRSELVTEFAKDLTWEKREHTLNNQYYVWGKQYHKMWRVRHEVLVTITDAPLMHSVLYSNEEDETFKKMVYESFNKFNNINYFIKRVKKYDVAGRSQTKEQAEELDLNVLEMLKKYRIKYKTVPGTSGGINTITGDILDMYNIEMLEDIGVIYGD
jgi:hypothetical protein